MHLQIRVKAVNSPPDVEKLLRLLAEGGVSLGGAGGSNVEFDGEFAIALRDGDEDAAIAILEKNEYPFRKLEYKKDDALTLCWLEDKAGELHRCIRDVSERNLESGRIIRDILIGVPSDEGIPVQVYSEEVRTPQSLGRS